MSEIMRLSERTSPAVVAGEMQRMHVHRATPRWHLAEREQFARVKLAALGCVCRQVCEGGFPLNSTEYYRENSRAGAMQ